MLWIAPTEKDTGTETLEDRLWAAADQLRANSGLTSAQHSRPVLGLSETNHPFPNLRAAEGMPMMAAYAGCQDWDAVIPYTFEPKLEPNWNPYMRETLLGMIGPTKKEAGYVQYDLHVDNDDPTHLLFYENWTSRAHRVAHLASPHLKAFIARQDELLTAPVRLVFATRQA
jgi:quinol monooxygenase YgiN